MNQSYDIGDVARLSVTFKVDDVPTDPSTVDLKLKKPDASVLAFSYPASINKMATGEYLVQVPLDQEGTWYYRWISTGTAAGAEESWFKVRKNQTEAP